MRAFHVAVLTLHMCLKIIMILSHQEIFSMVTISARKIARNDQTDRLALLAIKAQIMEDPFRVTSSWNESLHFCRWQGVSCSHKHQRVTQLNLPSKSLTGYLSPPIGNLSFLRVIDLSDNSFKGDRVLLEISNLFRLQKLLLSNNSLGGLIPSSLSNCSKLRILELGGNNLTGEIPFQLGFLPELMVLHVGRNSLEGSISPHLGNLSSLRVFSAQLEILRLTENHISGNIPSSIGKLISLSSLYMDSNELRGTIPTSIGKLLTLQELNINQNELSGEIPSSFGNLTLLTKLWLNGNNLHGSIPSSLGNCQKLLLLNLSENSLSGTIPPSVIGLSSLSIYLDLSRNHLNGSLPWEVGHLKSLAALDVSQNALSGDIPGSLGDCTSLQGIYMEHNNFEGTIPESLRSLKGIEAMDLSNNNLSGHIPKDLAKLALLSKLNLSFNDLQGELPTGGVFGNVTAIAVVGNNKLCGGIPQLHLAACFKKELNKRNLSRLSKLIICVASSLLGVCLVLCFLIIFWCKERKRPSESFQRNPFINISYGELLKATNGFTGDNLIGVGSFGSVYKGILEPHQTHVAVKVFNLEKRGASKSFMAECETLRNTRHRNLVKIITACSSADYQGNDFKALVYELMPNGSLETWLHPFPQTNNEDKKRLTLSQRLNMVIDVAYAIDYLHSHTESPIIHCDLKPSNILLDQEMTAHVGDFGLSRIIADQISENNTSSVGIKGTLGYAAPEYGMGSKVSTEGDMYSFGILLLEIFTGKRPTDGEFGDGENINMFVKKALPEKVAEIVDPNLVPEREEEQASSSNRSVQAAKRNKIHECLISILRIGVMCSNESPKERMKINDVLKELLAIKNMLLEDGRSN